MVKNLCRVLQENKVEIYGDETVSAVSELVKASNGRRLVYGRLRAFCKCESCSRNVEEAITHINKYGTQHSEAILTNDDKNAALFLNKVDAAAVYHNVQTYKDYLAENDYEVNDSGALARRWSSLQARKGETTRSSNSIYG